MQAIADNIRSLLPFLIVSWGVFFVFTLWRPQRFRNSVFLLIALFCTFFFVAGLFGDWFEYAFVTGCILVLLALLLVPVMLIMNGITMMKKESKAMGNLLSLILGIIIAAGEIACVFAVLSDGQRLVRISYDWPLFFGLTVFYFSVWILAFVLYIFVMQYMPHRMNFTYVIIHGCGLLDGTRMSRLLSNRLDKAIEIYKKCTVKPILIPSGGQGGNEKRSEAEAMQEYLLAKGIPEKYILPEDRSTTTMQNLLFSLDVIRKDGKKGRVALVSSNYHIYRCILYASGMKFKCIGIGAGVAWYYWPSATLREFAAIFTKLPHLFWILLGYCLTVIIPMLYLIKG